MWGDGGPIPLSRHAHVMSRSIKSSLPGPVKRPPEARRNLTKRDIVRLMLVNCREQTVTPAPPQLVGCGTPHRTRTPSARCDRDLSHRRPALPRRLAVPDVGGPKGIGGAERRRRSVPPARACVVRSKGRGSLLDPLIERRGTLSKFNEQSARGSPPPAFLSCQHEDGGLVRRPGLVVCLVGSCSSGVTRVAAAAAHSL